MPIRIAICQILTPYDIKASTDKIIAWIGKAAGYGAEVAVFPEVAIGGYKQESSYYHQIGCEAFGAAEARIVRAAEELGIATVVGTVRWAGPTLYNSLLIVDKGGQVLGHYDKLHPAEGWCVPGQQLPMYTLCGVPSCFLVCFDWRFPEITRLYAAAGAKVCYCCAFHNDPSYEHNMAAYAAIPVARAAENGIYFVSVTAPACAEDLHAGSHGRSRIIDPDGNTVSEGTAFGDQLVIGSIDPELATGRIAQRAVCDDTPLKQWLAEGTEIVRRHE